MYLIPSLLMNEKDPKWLTWESSRECPYFHMFGRICKLDRTMNPSTLPKIQHDLVKKFDKSMKSSILFQNGIFMEWDKCNILVELKSFHSVASVKIALSIDASSNDNINEILRYLKDSGKYLDSIFTNVVCGAADKQNPSTNLKRMVISLEEMREGTDSVTYDLDDILRRFGDNHKVIKSNSETAKEADCILPLLTASEIKMQRHLTEVCI